MIKLIVVNLAIELAVLGLKECIIKTNRKYNLTSKVKDKLSNISISFRKRAISM